MTVESPSSSGAHVELSTLAPGDSFEWRSHTDPNPPAVLVLTNGGGGEYMRLSDGALGTLSGEVLVLARAYKAVPV